MKFIRERRERVNRTKDKYHSAKKYPFDFYINTLDYKKKKLKIIIKLN